MHKGIRRKSFTLSEILITLTILGIIAAITIPYIVQRYKEKATVTKIKRVYALLENVYPMAILEKGSLDNWFGSTMKESGNNIFNNFKYYLNLTECNPEEDKCFAPQTEYKNILGGNSYILINNSFYLHDTHGILNNGVAIKIHPHTKAACLSGDYCFLIDVDVNGTKGPNRLGIDYFTFFGYYGDSKKSSYIIPSCTKNDCLSSDSTYRYAGNGCTCWIINKGNMKYRHNNVYAEWNF